MATDLPFGDCVPTNVVRAQFTVRGDRFPIDSEPMKTPEAWAMEDGEYVCEGIAKVAAARRALEGTADSPVQRGKRQRKTEKVQSHHTLYCPPEVGH